MVDTPQTLSAMLALFPDNASNNSLTPALMREVFVSIVRMFEIYSSTTYANDAAAAAGGVPVGQVYRNGNILQVRLS
jgi:hypothetical protein